jgi:hypothetical protein
MYVKEEKKKKVKVVLYKISKVIYLYLWGRVKVMPLPALMNYFTHYSQLVIGNIILIQIPNHLLADPK